MFVKNVIERLTTFSRRHTQLTQETDTRGGCLVRACKNSIDKEKVLTDGIFSAYNK